jgi:hypothetical protein
MFLKVLVVFIGLGVVVQIAIMGDSINNPRPQTPTVAATAQEDTTTMAFDIPKLVGKSIKQVSTILGPAAHTFVPTELQQGMGVVEADKTFDNAGVSLTVTYNAQTGIVKDYFLETPDPSGATANTVSLLKSGNLESTSDNYTIKFVPTIKDPSVYTGVVVTPL